MNKADQSFANLKKALASLEKSLATPAVEDRDFAGIIQNFEFVYELTWKTLQAILRADGVDVAFPRAVFEEAFKGKLIEGNEIWKKIMEDRNLSTHTYDSKLARELTARVMQDYLSVFQKTVTLIGKKLEV